MMKQLITVVLLALAATTSPPALAHGGAKPKHGGVVAVASDLGFELVSTLQGAALYIEDHGKPLAPAGIKGKLTVLNGREKSEAELTPAGDRLEAKGLVLRPGAKVVAVLTTAQAKAITVRFVVR